MEEFALIMRHEDGQKLASPEQMQIWMKQTMDWIGGIAALNRTYALSKTYSKQEAIADAEKLNLADNHFYFTLLGELYSDIDNRKAKQNFQQALSLAKTQTDKHVIQKKIDKF